MSRFGFWNYCRKQGFGWLPKAAREADVPPTLALAAWDLYEIRPEDVVPELSLETDTRARRMSWYMRLRFLDPSYTEEL
jgi:hypothetical protein